MSFVFDAVDGCAFLTSFDFACGTGSSAAFSLLLLLSSSTLSDSSSASSCGGCSRALGLRPLVFIKIKSLNIVLLSSSS